MTPRVQNVHGQPSWRLSLPGVAAWVTRLGGHLGPMSFRIGKSPRTIRPFHVAPWATEAATAGLPPVLRAMRGDFFCMPFGGNATRFQGEKHPAHGESANRTWKFQSLVRNASSTTLHLSLHTKIRPARIDKLVELRAGHPAVYVRHIVTGMSGPMSFGHHAMLRFRSPGHVSTSRFVRGEVAPVPFENPADSGYHSLRAGAAFRSLGKVPLATGGTTDLRCYPAREGFEDLVMLTADQHPSLAWTAVAFPEERFVWFALKNPRVLAHTVLWHSNGGRHYPPWNGRHRAVLGLEEVNSWFHYGLAESVSHGAAVEMHAETAREISYIMAVAEIPAGFEAVKSIRAVPAGVRLTCRRGAQVIVPLDSTFLR